jgi:predicted metal-dependent phosphoesterase TrpH
VNPKIKVDLHLHSNHSFDCPTPVQEVIKKAKEKGLTAIAITDHQSFAAHHVNLSTSDFFVIPGMEIGTEKGDIIGLFLKKEITSRKSEEVLREIREQGAIAMIPHPFKRKRFVDLEFLKRADFIEGWNARVNIPGVDLNGEAQAFAKANNIPFIACSDAHFPFEIGRAYTVIEAPVNSMEDIKQALLKRQFSVEGETSSMYVEPMSQALAFFKTGNIRFLARAVLFAVDLTWKKIKELLK